MANIMFEQPLNEKVRSYLRLEHLAEQLSNHANKDTGMELFTPLFALCDITDRCDFRNDLIKELDRHLAQIKRWRNVENVDQEQLNECIRSLTEIRRELSYSGRLGLNTRSDKFLSAVRQRYNMPGGCCSFDLPQLHYWLAGPWSVRKQQIAKWQGEFALLFNAIDAILQLTRQSGEFVTQEAKSGFYQYSSDMPLALVRVELSRDSLCYPTVSGNKQRFSIQMLRFDNQTRASNDVAFSIACCPETK
ncbi:cell division protein ZapD [Paraferrimonas sedimenticola]|uniref:Cell division protein ZapD n=1 Tax=Paraferrimonas sedimenticola TaxID=375674 RepID=A0AA37W2B9_9GAMM|nr:cell division protein ZapD [Paraferrimonas sedimenticola]GLP97468.1 cell division protein ZapD [Paraferrimonas sedimenticola]